MGQLEGGGTARGTECRTERVAHGGERAHTGSCADGLAACMPPVLVSGVVMMCASLETVAHIKLVSTVEGPPTKLTALFLRPPTTRKSLLYCKPHQQCTSPERERQGGGEREREGESSL